MNTIDVQFKDLESSPALEANIRDNVKRLETYADDIQSRRVAVHAPHKHHAHGRLFRVVIDLKLAGREVVVGDAHDDNLAHEDPHIAVRDAFRTARRSLQDGERKARGH